MKCDNNVSVVVISENIFILMKNNCAKYLFRNLLGVLNCIYFEILLIKIVKQKVINCLCFCFGCDADNLNLPSVNNLESE